MKILYFGDTSWGAAVGMGHAETFMLSREVG